MKYQITITVEGGEDLKHDIEAGYVEVGIKSDVFPDENILSFSCKELTNNNNDKDEIQN